MKTNPTIIAAAILGASIIISSSIRGCANHFTAIPGNTMSNSLSHSNWTGTFFTIKGEKIPIRH